MIAASPKNLICKHCQTPHHFEDSEFCCSGCETAWHVIRGRGLEEYYRFRDQTKAAPVGPASASFSYLASEDYRAQHITESDGKLQCEWYLSGLHCPACVWLVEKVSQAHPGVAGSELTFSDGRLVLFFEEDTDLKTLAENLADLGYMAGLQKERAGSTNKELLKLGISGAIAANIMLMSTPFYTGLSEGWYGWLFGWISFGLTLPLMLYCARDFFIRAKAGLKHNAIDLDLPIAIGLGSAWLLSAFNLIRGDLHHIYFDSMGMLVFFLLVGRHVQRSGINKALAEGRRLLAKMPQLVEVERNNQWTPLPAEEVVPGDRLRLRSGDILPVDATLCSSEAVLNLHVVSGESKPIRLKQGDQLLSGSVNMGAQMEVIATAAFDNTQFARLEQIARQLSERKQDVKGNRLALTFMTGVTICALAGIGIWWTTSPFQAFSVALTIFIVACPCALALAEPTAQAFALRDTSRLGIWIKNADIFRRLRDIRQVVFDKTGILTNGKPVIVEKKIFVENPHWLEAAILELESGARHPVVEAFRQGLSPKLKTGPAMDAHVLPGSGLSGTIDGHHLILSSPKGLARFEVPRETRETLTDACRDLPLGSTRICAVLNGRPAAVFALKDAIRPEAKKLTNQLIKQGFALTVLSGDDQPTVDEVGGQLGIGQRRGNMLPEAKLEYLRGLSPEETLMAGDGLNDMGALAASGVAVTHDEASDAAIKFADVIFQGRDMGRLAALPGLAGSVKIAVRRSIVLSLTYNAVAVSLSLTGLIGPLIAAILMPLSSLSMIGMTAWTFRRRRLSWES